MASEPRPHDPEIEQLEDELRESRVKKWDVEEFLVRRHEAKIEALSGAKSKWPARWEAIKEVGSLFLALLGGWVVLFVGSLWFAFGAFPLELSLNW